MSPPPIEEEIWQGRAIQPKTGGQQLAGIQYSPPDAQSPSNLPVEHILCILTEKQGISNTVSAANQEVILNACINIEKTQRMKKYH